MNFVEQFYNNIIVLDTETTGTNIDVDDIIEMSFRLQDEGYVQTLTTRYKSHIPVPPESSAIHFISNKDISTCQYIESELPTLNEIFSLKGYYVGHNVEFDKQMIESNNKRYGNHIDESVFDSNKWICTLRFAKKLFAENKEFSNFQLSYLWFKFGLNEQEERNITPHSAEDDVYMCQRVLEYLVSYSLQHNIINDKSDIGAQIVKFCNEILIYEFMPMGKYKGLKMNDVPFDYICWMIKNSDVLDERLTSYDPDFANTILYEYERRTTVASEETTDTDIDSK